MIKTEIMNESADSCSIMNSIEISKSIEQLFDDCLNFISVSSFEI